MMWRRRIGRHITRTSRLPRRASTVRDVFTNSIFGFLRSAVLLAVAGAGLAAGYDTAGLVTFV
jgi:hypothetical protein